MSKKILFILGPLALIAVGFILYSVIVGGGTKIPADATKQKKLVYWGVFNESGDIADIVSAYRVCTQTLLLNTANSSPRNTNKHYWRLGLKMKGRTFFQSITVG